MWREIAARARTEEGYIQVHGGRVWYKIYGADQPGLPLLAVHGGPGLSHDYILPLAGLADTRPVIFYDQLGCLRSDHPDDASLWTLAHYRAELHQVRQALGLARLFLLGQSWGTMLTADYCLHQTAEGVAALALCGPVMSTPEFIADANMLADEMPPPHREAIAAAKQSGDFTTPAFEAAADAYDKQHICMLDPWPDFVLASEEAPNMAIYRQMWGPSEFIARGSLRDFDLTPELPQLNIPVLFTCGEFDESRPATVARHQRLTPRGELAYFPGASHMHHVEQPEKFLAVLADFFARHEKSCC